MATTRTRTARLERSAPSENGGAGSSRLEMVREAARTHFAARGYEAASMRDIAADAGINIATLYFYCATKEQLLYDVLAEAQQQLHDGLRQRIATAGPSWTDRLTSAIAFHLQFCAEKSFGTTVNKVDIQRLTDAHRATYVGMRDAYDREFRQLIQGGIAAGEFRPVDSKLISFAIIGTGLNVGRWYRPDGELTIAQIAEHYVDFILAGLRA